MCSEEIKNVLVLGTTTFRVSQFCKLFEAYLSYDSHEDAVRWQPDINKDDGIECSLFFFNNLRLISTPNLKDLHISKQIISISSNLEEKQSLSAIIILINPSQNDDIHLGKLRQHLFRDLDEISDNILYVNAFESDFYEYGQIMKQRFDMITTKKNVFTFNDNTFFNVTAENWLYGVNFCKNIKDYIMGNENNCGLETIYINNKISDELLLSVIDNLTELLILIYICISINHNEVVDRKWKQRQISIGEFKRNITVCHGNACIQKIQFDSALECSSRYLSMKIPKYCHSSCSCLGANTNVAKCMVFDAVSKTCKQCKCKIELHSRDYFKTSIATTDINEEQVNQEKKIIINILATVSLFRKQNKQVLNTKDTFDKFLNLNDGSSNTLFNGFKIAFNQKVKQIETASQPITNKDVVVSINSLYEIKEGATIIPKFMEEIFPKDFQFEIVANSSSKPKSTTTIASGIDEKMEIQMLKNRVIKLEHMMYKMLSSNKNSATEESGIDLNSKLIQEASTSNINLNQNEKDSEEKEMNWNIEAK